MPYPDLREKDADPNDPTNTHTTRATAGETAPGGRFGRNGWVAALVAIAAMAAIALFVITTTDMATETDSDPVAGPTAEPAEPQSGTGSD